MAGSPENNLRNAAILSGFAAVGATRELPIPMGKIAVGTAVGTAVVAAGAEAVTRMRRRRRRLRME